MPQRWMLPDGGDKRNNPNAIASQTDAHTADINTDLVEMMRVLQMVQNAGNMARRDILCQCAGQNMSTQSKQFLCVHETHLPSTTS